ncbi:trypsin-like serine peptidase [Kineococcus sp. DHX-1]|uniref:trypsin-like serine peptidase n=1 Tax=Kineococcus sp. DHX-1 TaxID=3349638 RepID=UPI0036D37814
MRTHLTRRLIAASSAAVVTLGGAATFAATTASAAPGGGVSLLSTVDASGQQAALDYWTAERLAQAAPLDRTVTNRGAGAPGAAAAVGVPQPPAAAPRPRSTSVAQGEAPSLPRGGRAASGVVTGDAVSTARNWVGGALPTVGRLYFTQGTGKYECTASSVDSPKGNVIVTAGHCVTENRLDSKNLIFVPGLAGASEPQGRFAVGQTFTTTQWRTSDQQSSAALSYDVGFALVTPRSGKSLKDTVGANRIAFDTPLARTTVLGYPGRSTTADGFTLQYCTGTQFTDNGPGATTDVATLCDLGGGSSGGPWVHDFDPATGTGTVTSVTSFSYDDNTSVLYGPRFGSVVRDVYTQAANA